jgi:ABC-type branched-subunit amino acid transport system ATPase component
MTLQVKNLLKHFDGVQAVRGVSFEILTGECVALIGPNGAGKSTMFACIAGQQHLSAGEVWWAGARIDGLTPAQRLKRGVARTFQVAQTFEALTVLQNVQLLLQAPQGLAAWNVLDAEQSGGAHALLERVGLQHLAEADVLGLPYGARKRLELALALAGITSSGANAVGATSGARLLLLDEPAAGLAGTERADLMALVKSLAADPAAGLAVLYTEHNMDAVFGVADRVLVLIDGLLAAEGSAQEIAQNEIVRSRYLGHPAASVSAEPLAARTEAAEAVLSVRNLNVWYGAAQALFNLSLQVAPGELLVLQGLNGAGKSTLLQAIMGLSPRATGVISYKNESISESEPHLRAQLGLGYVAEDRRLFAGLSVLENLCLAARGDVQSQLALALELFPALKPMLRRRAGEISGGEQQMLAIARTLMTQPELLLLDEPCEGIAPVLIERIVAALLALKAQGMPMLIAEQNSLLAGSASRVITLVAGQVKP